MISLFKVIAALFVCLTVMIMAIIPSAVQADQAGDSVPNTQSQVCPENKCTPYDPRFKGLERVAIYVHLSGEYKYAVECHERMEECLKRRGAKESPERNVRIRQRLMDVYEGLPQPLYRDNLIALLKGRVEQEVMPHVKFQNSCIKPEIIIGGASSIIDKDSKDSFLLRDLLKDPNALIVDVSVNLLDDVKPRIAMLYLYAYRVGGTAHRQVFPSELMIIPMDLPQEEITKLVKDFVQRFEVVTTCEMSRTLR